MSTCIVFHSSITYTDEQISLLKNLLLKKPDLFCVIGVDCQNWEEAMDWVYIESTPIDSDLVMSTTSHPDETLEDVIAFATQWCDLRKLPREISIIHV